MEKRGLSRILAMVLVMVIAILAAILIWGYMRSTVTEASERVYLQEKCFVTSTEMLNCEYGGPLQGNWFTTGLVKHKKGESTEIKVAFYTEDGNSIIKDLAPIDILESRKVLPPVLLGERPSYAVATPVVYSEDGRRSLTCPLEKRIPCMELNLTGNLCEIPTFVEDVSPFVLALVYPGDYEIEFPRCDISNADFGCDGNVNGHDIDFFVRTIVDEQWIKCNKTMICEGNCWDDPTWCDDNCV